MDLNRKIQNSFDHNNERPAFFINGCFYSYAIFDKTVSKIRQAICRSTLASDLIIGLVANDDIETYAAIIALWFEGKAYVPLNPDTPTERNNIIINESGLSMVLDSSLHPLFEEYHVIETKKLPDTVFDMPYKNCTGDELAYLLFTSGTTGIPKGVPITRDNLTGFITAFDAMGIELGQNDRCLQMFELTFDLSVMSYLVPLLKGACVYTVPKDKIKYGYITELLEEQELTIALMVPSILHYLRPYFEEIEFPALRYSLFCGEALPLELTEEWSKCIPNSSIINVYGPTEDTIFCTHYTFNKSLPNKSHNGILSFGKAMAGTDMIIIDENNQILLSNKSGELCLSGTQLTPGYFKNEAKNKEAFFEVVYHNKLTRFYKTGDLCYTDDEGDFYYLGRLDYQIKIQGFRVELSEIEFHCKAYLNKLNVVAIAFTDKKGNTDIGLAIESNTIDTSGLVEYMKLRIPSYMIPSQIRFIKPFPLNVNGKTDRKVLTQIYS